MRSLYKRSKNTLLVGCKWCTDVYIPNVGTLFAKKFKWGHKDVYILLYII